MNNKKLLVIKFVKNLIYIGKITCISIHFFRTYAAFEADNGNVNSTKDDETTNSYKHNPAFNGYYIVSELDDVLKNGCCKSPLGYNSVECFVSEVTKIEKVRGF